jgi:ribosomal protein S6--L-glutamate ligase
MNGAMRITILSAGTGWHVRDLRRAAVERGHAVALADFRTLSAGVRADPPPRTDADAVVVRTMPAGSLEQVVFRMDLLHEAQARGVAVWNSPRALESCIDKYLTTAQLDRAGLPVPPTVACQTAEAAIDAFHRLGGDVVVKPLFGSEGRGLFRITDGEMAWRTFHALERLQSLIYVQQFLRHPGWDLRLFVLGGQVLAAMRRHATDGWRTNVAQGGRAEAVSPTTEEERIAIAAARTVGAEIAGVDLLPTADGNRVVLEVNAVPGWRALSAACRIDVAGEIIRFIEGDDRA